MRKRARRSCTSADTVSGEGWLDTEGRNEMLINTYCGRLLLGASVIAAALVGAAHAEAQDRTLTSGDGQTWVGGGSRASFSGNIGSNAQTTHRVAAAISNAVAFNGGAAEASLFGRRERLFDVSVSASANRSGTTLATASSCARGSFFILGKDLLPARGRCNPFGENNGFETPDEPILEKTFFSQLGQVPVGPFSVDVSMSVRGAVLVRMKASVQNSTRSQGLASAQAIVFAALNTRASASGTFLGFGPEITVFMEIIGADIKPSHTAMRFFGTNIDPNPAINTYYSVRSDIPMSVRGLDGKVVATLQTPFGGIWSTTVWDPKPLFSKTATFTDFQHAVLSSSFR